MGADLHLKLALPVSDRVLLLSVQSVADNDVEHADRRKNAGSRASCLTRANSWIPSVTQIGLGACKRM